MNNYFIKSKEAKIMKTAEYTNLETSTTPEDPEILEEILRFIRENTVYHDTDHKIQLQTSGTIPRIFESSIKKHFIDSNYEISTGDFDIHFRGNQIILEVTSKKVTLNQNGSDNISVIVNGIMSAINKKIKDFKRKAKRNKNAVFIVAIHVLTNHVSNIITGYPQKIYPIIENNIKNIPELSGVILSLHSPYAWFPEITNKYWGTQYDKSFTDYLILIKNSNANDQLPDIDLGFNVFNLSDV